MKRNNSIIKVENSNYRLIGLLVSSLFAFSQEDSNVVEYEKPDYDLIKKNIVDKSSDFYYPTLYNRYISGDSGLNLEESRSEEFAKKSREANKGDLVIATTSENDEDVCKDDLIRKEYPSPPSQNHYLVIDVELVEDTEFKDVVWEFNKLSDYKSSYSAGIPFAVSLTELMKHKVK